MMNQKLRVVAATSAIWIIFLSCCNATLKITTWFIEQDKLSPACQAELALIRKDDNGNITAALSLLDANNYRCYSPSDDEAWRTDLTTCKATCKGME